MLVKRLAACMYPSIFNHFWDIVVYRWRVSGFQQYSWANERFFNHILLSPGYAPGTVTVNVTWIEREFNACQTHRSMYTPWHLSSTVYELKRDIGRKSQLFPTPLHLTPPYMAPGIIAVNVTRLERGFNAYKTPRCIYPSIFNRFPVIQAWTLRVRHFSTFFCTFWPPLCTPLGQSR